MAFSVPISNFGRLLHAEPVPVAAQRPRLDQDEAQLLSPGHFSAPGDGAIGEAPHPPQERPQTPSLLFSPDEALPDAHSDGFPSHSGGCHSDPVSEDEPFHQPAWSDEVGSFSASPGKEHVSFDQHKGSRDLNSSSQFFRESVQARGETRGPPEQPPLHPVTKEAHKSSLLKILTAGHEALLHRAGNRIRIHFRLEYSLSSAPHDLSAIRSSRLCIKHISNTSSHSSFGDLGGAESTLAGKEEFWGADEITDVLLGIRHPDFVCIPKELPSHQKLCISLLSCQRNTPPRRPPKGTSIHGQPTSEEIELFDPIVELSRPPQVVKVNKSLNLEFLNPDSVVLWLIGIDLLLSNVRRGEAK